MDPLKIDVGAEIIDLVKRLGAPPPARRTERRAERLREPVRTAPDTDAPEPPEAA